jgi:hypothetical protein
LLLSQEEEEHPSSKITQMGDKSSMDLKLNDIETITNNFSEKLKVGSGEYGDVYKVWFYLIINATGCYKLGRANK